MDQMYEYEISPSSSRPLPKSDLERRARLPSLGVVLRAERLKAGITQLQLALRLGISPWKLNRIEHEVTLFPDELLGRLPVEIAQPLIEIKRARLESEIRRLPKV